MRSSVVGIRYDKKIDQCANLLAATLNDKSQDVCDNTCFKMKAAAMYCTFFLGDPQLERVERYSICQAVQWIDFTFCCQCVAKPLFPRSGCVNFTHAYQEASRRQWAKTFF